MSLRKLQVIAALLGLALLTLSSSAGSIQSAIPSATLAGFWITDGYGYLFKAEGTRLVAYELTSLSCIKSWSATRQAAASTDSGITFIGKEGDTLRVLPGPSADLKLFHEEGSASNLVARRIAEPPAVFLAATPNTPLSNFDVFWTTFAEQYPFFEMKGIDWAATAEKHRAELKSSTAPRELFEILRAMIEPLHDAHTFIAARDIKKYYFGWRSDTRRLSEPELNRAIEIIKTKYLRTPLRQFCGGHVRFSMLDGSIGYLRVDAFAGYAKENDYAKSAQSLEAALDSIFQDSAKLRGLIIDVRINDGGADPLGLLISSRLTERSYLAYTKEARIDPADPRKWSPGQDCIVPSTTRPHFYGPVVLLTGPRTVSAGETFAMSLMERAPSVLRLGENTQGVFSDVLERSLPNGWSFGLPNERYLTKDRRTFDGPGIPPDVSVAVFPKTDLDGGRDGALEKAIALLNKR